MVSLTLLGVILAIMTAVMISAWIVQRRVGDSGWIDVFWTYGTGAVGVLAALWPSPEALAERQILVAGIVGLWAARLGTYIVLRVVRSTQEDARYAGFKADWGDSYQTRIFWLILPQALITTIMMVSVAVAASRPGALDIRDGLAVAILLIAIGGESLADHQLARFKKTNTKKGAICEAGLWGWSRHPNYFFEWLGWLAYPVMALTLDSPLSWLTLLAPVTMFIVLRFITGVPPLEATMLQSRGDAFRDYQRRVSPFTPLPPHRSSTP